MVARGADVTKMKMMMLTVARVAAAPAEVGWAVARCTDPGLGARLAAAQCSLLPDRTGLLWMLQEGCLCGRTGGATGCVRAGRS